MQIRSDAPNLPSQSHPLVHAGKWLLSDLLSTLTFIGLYAITHNIFVAAGTAIALGLAQFGYLKLSGAPIDLMQWLSLGLVIVFGGATLLTRDPVFVMVKPTLIYSAIGAVMLRPGWINRYLPPVRGIDIAGIATVFGYVWAALMFATAAANLAFALYASPLTWAWFIGVFPLASKFILVAIQYFVTRAIVRRRIRTSAYAPLAPPLGQHR